MRVEDEGIGNKDGGLDRLIEAIIPGIVHDADNLKPSVRITDGRGIGNIHFQAWDAHRLLQDIAARSKLFNEGAVDQGHMRSASRLFPGVKASGKEWRAQSRKHIEAD